MQIPVFLLIKIRKLVAQRLYGGFDISLDKPIKWCIDE